MKQKMLIALLLAIITVFSVAGCSLGAQNDLQAKIDDLQSQLNDRQSQIEELEDRLAELEDQLRDRDERIDQLERELAEKSVGTFYSLQEAYDNGYLTKEDLQSLEKNKSHGWWDFPELAIQQAIKKDYFYIFKKSSSASIYPYATVDDMFMYDYYGDYHGYMVVQMSSIYEQYPDVSMEYIIADIVITYSGPDILVWQYN